MFKKIRKEITDIKNDFFEATAESECRVLNQFNVLVHFTISMLIWTIGLMFYIFNLKTVAVIIGLLSVIYIIIAGFTRFFKVTGRLSYKLLFKLFGRYGKVVSKKDWKNIKKYCKKLYKKAISKKSKGHCYFYSWAIALYLQDAKLMYCSEELKDGRLSAHAVIVKDNCVYDTNDRRHYNYDEYIKLYNVMVYKMFSEEEYRKKTFLMIFVQNL